LLRRNEILLKEYVSTLEIPVNVTINHHVAVGEIFNDIGKIASYHGADLVIMGTHGVDVMQKLFGSNAVKIIKNATVPFIVIQEGCEIKQLNKIVIPISIEKKSMQVFTFCGKTITTLRCRNPFSGKITLR
jgi:hypothetical protein